MLRITASKSAAGAKEYFGKGLIRADYYLDGQEIAGLWHGKGAELLGLSGEVDQKNYFDLCDNIKPGTKENLTPRTKEDRRPGFDFTFSAPKAVSVVYALSGDERILAAFRESVRETMQDVEADMKTRVRKGGKDEDRATGTMAWAEFIHFTGRPVDEKDFGMVNLYEGTPEEKQEWGNRLSGLPDPHLHTHAYAFNATFDKEENRWKAGQFGDLKREATYYEASFHSRFADRLNSLGYTTERKGNSFTLAGSPQTLTDKFSRRRNSVEKTAAAKGITDPKAKHEITRRGRQKKNSDLGREELRQVWDKCLSKSEREAVSEIVHGKAKPIHQLSAEQANAYVKDHVFQRQSSISEKRLKAEAMRYAVGTVLPRDIERVFRQDKDYVKVKHDGRDMVTTREMLNLEIEMLAYARNGNGKHKPLGEASYHIPETLSAEQGGAVSRMINSRDGVIGFRGGAGTGKTTALAALVKGVERGGEGTQVIGAAVSTGAVKALKDVGIADSHTLAGLLHNKTLQSSLKDKVLLIDEASQISTRDMVAVFRIAKEQKARVILSGDYLQHGSVDAADAFRLLASEAGTKFAELKEIYRQTDPTYKKAVEHIAKGTRAGVQKGYDLLDKHGSIIELSGEERHKALIADYLDTISEKKKVKDVKTGIWRTEAKTGLIVTPTNAEAARITEELRGTLKKRGDIDDKDRIYKVRSSTGWTDAQKGDHRNYEKGMVVQFFQNVGQVKKSSVGVVSGKDTTGRVKVLMQDGQKIALPTERTQHFEIYRVNDLSVAKGDRIRLTQNGKLLRDSGREKRVSNGDISTVTGFHEDGAIRLSDGSILPSTWGHFKHGYVDTSYGSQGRTTDRVHIAAGSSSVLAVNAQQWYVSVSRGRESATVYVDDKAAMREAITRKGERLAAVELVKGTQHEKKPTGWRDRAKEMLERINVRRYWKERQQKAERGRQHGRSI